MPTLRSKLKLTAHSQATKRPVCTGPTAREESNPGRVSLESAPSLLVAGHTLGTRSADRRPARSQCQPQSWMDAITDPEPDMDRGQATVRNMRSKCRCSYVLQFTFRRAVSCVLHRPPSQVIHCTVLFHRLTCHKGT